MVQANLAETEFEKVYPEKVFVHGQYRPRSSQEAGSTELPNQSALVQNVRRIKDAMNTARQHFSCFKAQCDDINMSTLVDLSATEAAELQQQHKYYQDEMAKAKDEMIKLDKE